MRRIKCPKCGTEFESKFCPECGFNSADYVEETIPEASVVDTNCEPKESQVLKESEIPKESPKLPSSPKAKKSQKGKKKILLAIGAVILALILITSIRSAITKSRKKNFVADAYQEEMIGYSNGELSYEMPTSWKLSSNQEFFSGCVEEEESEVIKISIGHISGFDFRDDFDDIYDQYSYHENEYEKNHIISLTKEENYETKNCKGKYAQYECSDTEEGKEPNDYDKYLYIMKVDESYYVINIDVKKEYYKEEDINLILEHIDFADFETPRVDSIEANYTGNTEAGTKMTADEIDGLEVIVNYDNGEQDLITSGYKITGPEIILPNTKKDYSISYTAADGKEFEATFQVECSTKIKKITAKYKGSTEEGTKLDISNDGIQVTAYYEDGSNEVIKSGFSVKKDKTLKAGKTAEITIDYYGFTCDLSVKCTTLTEKEKKADFKSKCKSYSYDNLARYPDKYSSKKIKVEGKVLQVGSDFIRLAKDGDYDHVIYITITYITDTPKGNILEDDYINVYGYGNGQITYESVLGASITIPGIEARYIER
ncbi:MAG: zinc ribbon domain-containing protein [Eubacteriales bacterium]|nr:zinc ribbon domain-containing protein [Eubacteriales bacterium]